MRRKRGAAELLLFCGIVILREADRADVIAGVIALGQVVAVDPADAQAGVDHVPAADVDADVGDAAGRRAR